MILSDKFLIKRVFDTYCIFPTCQAALDGAKPMKINDMGYTILNLIKDNHSVEAIQNMLIKEYDISSGEEKEICEAVSNFISLMQKKKVLI